MKKRKMFFLLSTVILAFTLASCSGKDYKAKEFNYDSPTKKSDATIEYDTKESKGDLSKFYTDMFNDNRAQNINFEGEFFSKYKSIIATSAYKSIFSEDNEKIECFVEQKSIIEPVAGNLYYYEHSLRKTNDEVVEELSIESNASFTNEKVTVITDISMVDFSFNLTYIENGNYDGFYYAKKATGSLKLKFEYENNVDESDLCVTLYYMTLIPNVMGLGSDMYQNIYTNKDKSYLYFECTTKYDNSLDKSIYVGENYMAKNIWHSCIKKDFEKIEKVEYDYIKYNVLGDTLNTNGYTLVDIPDDFKFKGIIPFAFQPFDVLWFDCQNQLSVLLSNNSTITSTLTVTEIG